MLSRLSRHRRLQPGRRTLLAWVFPSRPLSMSKVSRSPFLMSSGSMPADYSALTCRNTSGPPASSPMKPKPRGRHSDIFKVPVGIAFYAVSHESFVILQFDIKALDVH